MMIPLQRLPILPLLLVAAIGPQEAIRAADPWPIFRGPGGNGVAPAGFDPPVTWSSKENITWRTELPGEGWSSPVVGAGKIYLSAAIPRRHDSQDSDSSTDYELSLLIFDAESGELLNTVAVLQQAGADAPRIHKKNSHASPTPILDGDRIYAHFGYQGTACLTRDGRKIWTNRDLFFQPVHGNGGTPVLVDGRLVFTCDGRDEPKIVALDAGSGKLLWQTDRPVEAKKKFSFCTPTLIEVGGSKQIIAPGSDCVLGINPTTGDVIWDVRYDGYSVVPKPVYERGHVFVSTSFDQPKLLAIRPTGTGVVTDSHVSWQVDKNIPKTPSLIAHEGLVYCISDNGIMLCIDAETGDIQYRQRIGGNFSASPVFAAGRLYFTSEEGVTTVIKAGPEFEQIAVNDLGERTLASMALVDNAIILRTANALYRIEK